MPGGLNKTMEVFGEQWDHHFEKISADWRERVTDQDVVLIPGDISWAMYLEDAKADLDAISTLPGTKIMIRGNHDFWWSPISRLRSLLPEKFIALQQSATDCGPFVVCGTRGWMFPGMEQYKEEKDEKIYQRELQRLKMALEDARHLSATKPLIAMTHFPPLSYEIQSTGFTELLEKYQVQVAVYAHLHGRGITGAFQGELRGIQYHLCSCDALDFTLREITIKDNTKM